MEAEVVETTPEVLRELALKVARTIPDGTSFESISLVMAAGLASFGAQIALHTDVANGLEFIRSTAETAGKLLIEDAKAQLKEAANVE